MSADREAAYATDEELLARFPGVRIDRDNQHYYRGLIEQRLLLNRCAVCATWHHPPRASCPHCWSWDVTATEVSGHGTIHLFSFLSTRAAHGATSPAADPYPVVVVDLEEGVRFTATAVDCRKERLAIDMPVSLTWIEEDGMPTPAFRPVS